MFAPFGASFIGLPERPPLGNVAGVVLTILGVGIVFREGLVAEGRAAFGREGEVSYLGLALGPACAGGLRL